jgi:hypothetical protein
MPQPLRWGRFSSLVRIGRLRRPTKGSSPLLPGTRKPENSEFRSGAACIDPSTPSETTGWRLVWHTTVINHVWSAPTVLERFLRYLDDPATQRTLLVAQIPKLWIDQRALHCNGLRAIVCPHPGGGLAVARPESSTAIPIPLKGKHFRALNFSRGAIPVGEYFGAVRPGRQPGQPVVRPGDGGATGSRCPVRPPPALLKRGRTANRRSAAPPIGVVRPERSRRYSSRQGEIAVPSPRGWPPRRTGRSRLASWTILL